MEPALDLGLEGRVAMVLGAGGGLGGATAMALAREGAVVAACGIHPEPLEERVREATSDGGNMSSFPFDLGDRHGRSAAVQDIQTSLGEVEILVNITGGPPPTSVTETDLEAWGKYFGPMVESVIDITNQVLPSMRASKWGRIITCTSSGVIAPIPSLSISNILRASLVTWSKTLAAEVGGDGVTTNVVVPGRIGTSRVGSLDAAKAEREGRSVEDVMLASTQSIPLARYGEPEEFGDVVAFLASERASYIHGSVVRIDGGYVPNV